MTCLHGRTAIISGGSRGIGLAIAQRLAKDGLNLMISAQNEYGVCDILIYSAGATKSGIFPTQPDEDFIDDFALKFHAGLRLSRLFWPMLKLAKGNVIMIVGGAARTPDHTFMVGSSVNAALVNYSKALAGQGLPDDVNVNWVSPGQTETSRLPKLLAQRADSNQAHLELVANNLQAHSTARVSSHSADLRSLAGCETEFAAQDEGKTVDTVRQERIQNEGIRRLGRPEYIAELVCFLCGDKSRHIHGVGIAVDGGATKGYF